MYFSLCVILKNDYQTGTKRKGNRVKKAKKLASSSSLTGGKESGTVLKKEKSKGSKGDRPRGMSLHRP